MRVSELACLTALIVLSSAQCLPYLAYSTQAHKPLSSGRYKLPSMRPIAFCRTFRAPDVESEIARMKGVIKDPDLYALYQNTWPNTLDTTIRWRGFANGTDEELSFIITGDITAMWLRDSANQLQSYLSQLKADPSPDSLAGLWRGAINLQARYIIEAPYCNAFQAPEEAGIRVYNNMGSDSVFPSYDAYKVFSCDYELDSLASFLSLAADYADATGDYEFFSKYQFTKAVRSILKLAEDMQTPTYDTDGSVLASPFSFTAPYGGAPINSGRGSPVANGTGLVRSFFRPSDDACIFQFFIPANMFFSTALSRASKIFREMNKSPTFSKKLLVLARQIRRGVAEHAVVPTKQFGNVYAYEVDGYGSNNMMDDANTPSLLSMPLFGYLDANALSPENGDMNASEIYANTRKKVLSSQSPYFAKGTAMSGMGSPHTQPGRVWPMAIITRIRTSEDDDEIIEGLRLLLGSTDGYGLMHESVDAFRVSGWSRSWFAWANSLFGQMINELAVRKPHILEMSFQ